MSPEDLERIAAGAAKGALDWSAERIKGLVTKFLNKDLAFIEDQQTIDTVKSLRKQEEWKAYARYVKDFELKILIQSGLALRDFENHPIKLQNLRDNILSGFGEDGLHIAQLVQDGVLAILLSMAIKERSASDVANSIEGLLNDVDKFVEFAKVGDDAEKRASRLETLLNAQKPKIFVLFGSGFAKVNARKIAIELKRRIGDDYDLSNIEEAKKSIYFFVKRRG